MSGTQETGGQPTPEAVAEAYRESQPVLTLDQWRLTQPWRLSGADGMRGSNLGAIVCDPPPGHRDHNGDVEWYGGLPVCENCAPLIARQIVRLHNLAIGYGQDTPVRPAVIDDEVA